MRCSFICPKYNGKGHKAWDHVKLISLCRYSTVTRCSGQVLQGHSKCDDSCTLLCKNTFCVGSFVQTVYRNRDMATVTTLVNQSTLCFELTVFSRIHHANLTVAQLAKVTRLLCSPKFHYYVGFEVLIAMVSRWYFPRLIPSWRWRRNVPPKRRLTSNALHDVISQKVVFLIIVFTRALDVLLI
jgi:hypothetical protein